jgi:anti-sigma factor (TIGR02949 family)
MADCEETLRELEAFLDGELPLEELGDVRGHIEGCLDCLQAYDFYAELKVVIKQKCREQEVPPGLLERVRSCFGDQAAAPLQADPPA